MCLNPFSGIKRRLIFSRHAQNSDVPCKASPIRSSRGSGQQTHFSERAFFLIGYPFRLNDSAPHADKACGQDKEYTRVDSLRTFGRDK